MRTGGGGGGVIALQSTIFQKLFQNALDPLSTAHKIWWCDKTLAYDGIPYIILETKVFDCAQGKDRKEEIKRKKKLMRRVCIYSSNLPNRFTILSVLYMCSLLHVAVIFYSN